MCGIAGFIGKGNERDLQRMIATLKHRGPDQQGVFLSQGIGFANARLSIIDLSEDGRQPMFDREKKIGLVFNGEIYNFQTLRDELLATGRYFFKSKTDTEVIIYAYQEYGMRCFEKFNGMFAIALYDFNRGKLILGRDRMGKKPLYYGVFQETLVFGSEIKAVLAHPLVRKEINIGAVNKYLQYEYIPTPDSIFAGMFKLEPAQYLVWDTKIAEKGIFWQPNFIAPRATSLPEALNVLDRQLQESVRLRLIADVPLGVFLSGGIDSSTIAYYAQTASAKKIKTFSIGFREDSYDELRYAQMVAEALGTDHASRIVTSQDMLEVIPMVEELMDEPLADVSIIPTYLLSKFAREYVTVALAGDGGDELFCGYSTFQADKIARAYAKIPSLLRTVMIEPAIRALPVKDTYFSIDFRLKKFLDGFRGDRRYQHQLWLGSFSRPERAMLFSPSVWKEIAGYNEFEDIDRYYGEVRAADEESKILYLYQRTYMMDGVLVKVDRSSMANSLEVRAPFLDIDVVNFVNALPYDFKYRGFTTKYILKKLMEPRLPKEIVYRVKKGFGVPLSYWLKHDLKEFAARMLSHDALGRHGLFNPEYIANLCDRHNAGKENNARKLWTLIVFQLWYDRWFLGSSLV